MAKRRPKNPFGSGAFLAEVAELAQELRAEIAAAADLGDFDRSAKARAERVERGRRDFAFFCRTYFPHHVKGEPSRFHAWLWQRLPAIVFEPKGQREVIAAPRGNAKSTYVTQLFPLWCLLYGHKRYPMILSDALEVAAMMLEGVKAELEINPRLAHDFADQAGAGPVWQVGVIVTRGGAKVQAGGAGKRIRGARHGTQRPDLVVLDDIENDENVTSPEQRDKREKWLDRAVEPIGPPDGSMDLIYVGTVLHLDAVLVRKLRNPLWRATVFRAIERWPDRMDLWEQWEEALRNEGKEAAEAFHRAHAAEMEAGAEILWPAVQPLHLLMETRFRVGHAAFASEYQNNPEAEDAIFREIVFWVQPSPRWIHFGALDPSLGKNNRSRDPSAILVGGIDRETGILDVVEASIRRRLPDVIIAEVIAMQKRYRCAMWFVESVQFQEFLRTELMKRAVKEGVPLPAQAVTPTTDKALRIERLQPPMAAGLIRVHASQTTLLEQLRVYPRGDHDDGPDALEMLWAGAVGAGGTIEVGTTGQQRVASASRLDHYTGGFGRPSGVMW